MFVFVSGLMPPFFVRERSMGYISKNRISKRTLNSTKIINKNHFEINCIYSYNAIEILPEMMGHNKTTSIVIPFLLVGGEPVFHHQIPFLMLEYHN